MDKEYFASGQHIHDELLRRCAHLPNRVKLMWRESKRIHPSLLIWVKDAVKTTDGADFTGVVFTPLPEATGERWGAIANAVEKCGGFAILVTEQLDDRVRMIFESPHGTRTWSIPIKDHGGVQVLGVPTTADDVELVGVLRG